jgi:sulfatase modifying factor 1
MFTRKEFLKLLGIASLAALLDACSPLTKKTPEAILPTETRNPPTLTVEPTPKINSPIIPEMVLVQAGDFEMGSTDGSTNEQPIHLVTISKPFYMGKYEVTFEEFDTFCENTQRYILPDDKGEGRGNRPVAGVDWYDAVEYCNWLSEEEGLSPCYSGKGKLLECNFSANGYRLPTEAEWEYAARGGHISKGYIFAGSNNPDDVAWHGGNSGKKAHDVGQKAPNEIGLYDMSGNRFEWCWDWYIDNFYSESTAIDPTGPPLPKVDFPWELVRVRRSGNWGEGTQSIRTTARSFDDPSYPGDNGFRLVRNAKIV